MNISNKCYICKSKRCLVQCKCDKLLCLKHRYVTEHSCTFDIKEHAKSMLAASLVKVVADKLERI